jgi:hypothetical protein
MSNGGTYTVTLFDTGTTDISLLSVTGTVTIGTSALISLDLSALSSQVTTLRNTVGVGNTRPYTVMTGTSIPTKLNAGNFSISNLGNFASGEWTFKTNPAANTVQLNFTPGAGIGWGDGGVPGVDGGLPPPAAAQTCSRLNQSPGRPPARHALPPRASEAVATDRTVAMGTARCREWG